MNIKIIDGNTNSTLEIADITNEYYATEILNNFLAYNASIDEINYNRKTQKGKFCNILTNIKDGNDVQQ